VRVPAERQHEPGCRCNHLQKAGKWISACIPRAIFLYVQKLYLDFKMKLR